MLVCALGADRVTAIDVENYAVEEHGRDIYRVIKSDIESLVEEHQLPSATSSEDRALRLEALLPGDAGFPVLGDQLHYALTDGNQIPVPTESADFVYSCSVLEHVDSLALFYTEMARVTRSGGIWSHMIDLRDHCHPDPHDFLRYGDRLWASMQSRSPGFTNRLRASDHLRLIEASGMSVVFVKPTSVDHVPQRTSIHPRFHSYSHDDISTTNLAIVAVK
jgi:SAM-dependent methyltransferase